MNRKYRLVKHIHYGPAPLWDLQGWSEIESKWLTINTSFDYSNTDLLAWIDRHIPGIKFETIICKHVGNS